MTRPLAALERFFERLFERPAARLFQTGLEPVQVQRRLERALDAGNSAGSGFAPDRYEVYVNPEDRDALEDLRTTLEAELAEGLRARAHQRRYRLAQRPVVLIRPDPSVPHGEVAIEAGYGPLTPAPDRSIPPSTPGDLDAPGDLDVPGALIYGAPAAPGSRGLEWDVRDVPERPAIPELPSAVLLVAAPGTAESEFRLRAATVTIGRAPENDIALPDQRVSRRHGIISVRRGTLVYTDLGSSNGTRVNGRLVTEVALGHGDVLHIGDSTITVLGTG
jgi:hypothetical protein